jgi:transglutaminase-like putative cysteine protease
MRIAVDHSTLYHYDSPVYLEPHVFRLRPREDCTQRLLAWTFDITPEPLGRTHCLDQDGNVIVRAWFTTLTSQLVVRSRFELETLRENPFDYLPSDLDRRLPMQYAHPLRGPLAPCLDAMQTPAVREFARQLGEECEWQTAIFLTNLNLRLFSMTTQVIRDVGAPLPAEVTLLTKEGSCRDLAVLFCAVCRAVGLAARFVSGYERDASLEENGDLHAWAEVYLEGGGWRGYDPSRGLAVATAHVAVAAASEAALASPVTGTYRGAATATLEFSISMQVA